MDAVILDGHHLDPRALHRIATGSGVSVSDTARTEMRRTATDAPAPEKTAWLVGEDTEPDADIVRAFVLGHCAGVGEPLSPSLTRAIVAARINVLAKGYSGVRPELVDRLAQLLDANVVPVVPRQGSTGAAGCPQLAQIAAVYAGFDGEAWRDGERMPAERALEGLLPIEPNEKEALALLNGSTLTTALAAIAVVRARRVLDAAGRAAAMTFEVARADLGCLDPNAMQVRGHEGAIRVAAHLRAALSGSTLVSEGRRPDPFSIRCTPSVLGAAVQALDYVEDIVTHELNGAIDNPLIIPGHGVVEAGNFHAAPVALAMDHLKVALTQVASIAERRIFRITYGQLSGLPSYLVESNGLNSGLMLAQYTAASRLSECKGLAHPASVDSIPTIQHREDHVSMGPIAAWTALELIEAVADVVAIELLCAAQGMDLQRDLLDDVHFGHGTLHAHALVRLRVHHWSDDRVLHPDLVAAGDLVRSGRLNEPDGKLPPW